MNILGICSNADILKIIKIAVPIILILSCMIEVVRTITSEDNEITSKILKSWVTKVIAALLIFLIPTFVNILANISNSSTEFASVIKSELGKEATNLPNISIYKHCTIMAYYQVPELWEWMLKQ